ncbi:hypothetical protein [Pontibacter flavimaris]|jgi:CRISPR/Cas system endoribonuclease Cas6 (RAMP superfamily)|uniref:Uncharacterized protein n=1 Tax=Pontibacter flavimaris TaxID=1797110 RepID=A0A1Q5PC77_9BACT|nr:hypothetical protein [Pontibacter flavimaris]OKL39803.1 hypothetical protein A3841_15585 [Pontibacter flavimaris]
MTTRSFYDFNRGNPQERQEQYKHYPELALFHIALREELGEEEYNAFYRAEQEAQKRPVNPMSHQRKGKWVTA